MPQCVRVNRVKQAALDILIVPTILKRNRTDSEEIDQCRNV